MNVKIIIYEYLIAWNNTQEARYWPYDSSLIMQIRLQRTWWYYNGLLALLTWKLKTAKNEHSVAIYNWIINIKITQIFAVLKEKQKGESKDITKNVSEGFYRAQQIVQIWFCDTSGRQVLSSTAVGGIRKFVWYVTRSSVKFAQAVIRKTERFFSFEKHLQIDTIQKSIIIHRLD